MRLDYSLKDIGKGFSSVKHQIIRRFTNTSINKFQGGWWYGINAKPGDVDLNDAMLIPEVASILNKRASAHANIIIKVVNKKSGEEVDNNLSRLLKKPNWFQSTIEFIKQTNLFHDIYGNEYDYLFFGVGMKPENAKAMYTLSDEFMKIDYKSDTKYFMETEEPDVDYLYTFDGKRSDIPSEQIIHLNDNRTNIRAQDETLLKGESKLLSLSHPLRNIIAAYEARGIMILNRGALGILSNDNKDGIGSTIPIDDKERDKIQQDYRGYGLQGHQNQIIITNMALKWQKMGIDIDKLKLFEEIKEDAIKIAEAYNYPPELLVFEKGPTLFGENKKQAEKSWYQNSIIPEAQERIDAFNLKFQTDKKPYHIVGTFDHLPIFQKDRKDQTAVLTMTVTALSRALADQVITIDEYKIELQKLGFFEK